MVLPAEDGDDRRSARPRRDQAVVLGHRRRLRGDAGAAGRGALRAPRRCRFQARWNIEDCGPDACDYAYVEVDDGTRLQGHPGLDHQARRGQRHRRRHRRLQAGDVRPVGLRRQDGLAALPLQDRPGGAGQPRRDRPARHLPRRDQADQRHADAVHRRRRERRQRLDGDRVQRSSARPRRRSYDHYYIASNRTYTAYDRYLQTGPYNFGFPDRPDWVEHFPYQNGLLVSYWDTSFSDNNESVSTRARARSCRSTPTRR